MLAPTGKVLELVHDNYQSGAHKELMLKMWEKAQTEPLNRTDVPVGYQVSVLLASPPLQRT